MFQIGEAIVYGHSGVCRIEDIRQETFGSVTRTYYVLRPLHDAHSTVYCPVEQAENKLRALLTKAEIDRLIDALPQSDDQWVDNDSERRDRFSDTLKSGDRAQLLGLIRTLYLRRREKAEAGKKLHLADERVMHDAERLLHEEFAHVLGIQPTEVVEYIRARVEGA